MCCHTPEAAIQSALRIHGFHICIQSTLDLHSIYNYLHNIYNYLHNIYTVLGITRGFPGGSVVKNLPATQEPSRGFDPWVGKIPWRRKWQPTAVFLPGKSCGQRSLAAYSAWGCKELDTAHTRAHVLLHW